MVRIQAGRSQCQVTGTYVPVTEMNLAPGDQVYFPITSCCGPTLRRTGSHEYAPAGQGETPAFAAICLLSSWVIRSLFSRWAVAGGGALAGAGWFRIRMRPAW
jgi:hypothetical protein